MKLTADGRTILRGELRAIQPGRADRRDRPVPPRRDAGDDDPRSIRRPAATRAPSRWSIPRRTCCSIHDTRAPRTDEYSVGVDREVGRRLAVAVAYVRKDGANFIGWTDVGGQYREETRAAARRTQPARVRARHNRHSSSTGSC